MNLRYTSHQVPRGARADAETNDRIVLVKNVSLLRATYQIRLLAFKAQETRKKFVIFVPQACKVHGTLRGLMKLVPNVRVEKFVRA
jgi:hypothetical protein